MPTFPTDKPDVSHMPRRRCQLLQRPLSQKLQLLLLLLLFADIKPSGRRVRRDGGLEEPTTKQASKQLFSIDPRVATNPGVGVAWSRLFSQKESESDSKFGSRLRDLSGVKVAGVNSHSAFCRSWGRSLSTFSRIVATLINRVFY